MLRRFVFVICLLSLALPSAVLAAPPVGANTEATALAPLAVPYEDGFAIPLKAEQPWWYTPALAAQVTAAQPLAAPADAPLPSEFGIRPGAWMIEPYGCTMNFVFAKGGSSVGTAATKRWPG